MVHGFSSRTPSSLPMRGASAVMREWAQACSAVGRRPIGYTTLQGINRLARSFLIRRYTPVGLGILDGESPSGKAAVFGAAIRRFESFLPRTTGHGPVALVGIAAATI